MTFGTLYGNVSESNGLYGIGQLIPGSTYFEWFIFKESVGQPATPTGGTWNFDTNIGVPPTGWSSTSPNIPVNPVWFCIAFVDSRNPTVIVWSTPSKITAGSAAAAVDISFSPTGALTSTNVQSAIAEVVTDLALSSGSSTVGYLPAGTGAVATTVQTKLRESVSVKDFGATGNGSTDDTAAIQLAITYIYSFATSSGSGRPPALYFPKGTYLMSSTITMGNINYGWTISPYFFGDGTGTIIKVSATNVNPFYWRGPVLGQPGAGNQCPGPTIENMTFVGPGSGSATSSSIALNFNTVQGTTLINTSCSGWYVGENYVDHDVITRINASCDYNIIGINSSSLNNLIRLDRMQNNGGTITHNTTYGIFYMGGQTPSFNDVFFNSNGTSLLLSRQLASENVYPTVGPVIQGCYFEADTSYTMQFGGGAGIVRDMCIIGGAIAGNTAVPLIRVLNYADTTGRGFINMNANNAGAGGIIDQSSSAGKIAYQTLDNVAIGSVIPSTGVFTTVRSGIFIKSAGIGASVDLLSIGTFSSVASMSMTIIATSSGVATARLYQIILMGGGTVTGSDVSFITEVYSGGGSAFSLVETQNSPAAGTNKLSISNTSGVASTYRVTYTVEDLTGTLTLL